jgi:hypothetical protein
MKICASSVHLQSVLAPYTLTVISFENATILLPRSNHVTSFSPVSSWKPEHSILFTFQVLRFFYQSGYMSILMAGYRDQPFSLDIAFQGHDIQSQCALFQLPFEILSSIIELLPECSFHRLAIVNSDFYLIARSRQFATIDFRYSQRTLLLIQRLLSEVPGWDSILPKLPPFGHCVRNASLAIIGSKQIIKFHNQDWGDIPLYPEESDEFQRRDYDFEEQIGALHGYVGGLIQLVLVRLENLLWSPATYFKLNQKFLDNLVNSSIKSLSFGEFSLDDELFENDDKLVPMKPPSLERLQLGLGAITSADDVQQAYSFLLAHLGGTIRRLDLHLTKFCGSRMSITSKVELPVLEELRLAIQAPGVVATNFLQALLPADSVCHIHSLYVSLNRDQVSKEFFKKRGQIPSLKTLVWDDEDEQTSIAVLKANPQLRKVNIAPGLGRYLPLLAENFHQLTTLSVVLSNDNFSKGRSTFEMIGRIVSLENLHLGLEEEASDFSQRYWIADHNTIRDCFGLLRHIRILSFGFDIYHLHSLLLWHRYYADMILIAQIQVLLDYQAALPIFNSMPDRDAVSITGANLPTNVNPLQWEKEHKKRMLSAAEAYFQQHTKLNFIYLGQLAVRREMWSGAITCSPTRGRPPTRLESVFRFAE